MAWTDHRRRASPGEDGPEGELVPICRHCLADIDLMGDGDDRWWRHKATRSRYCSRDVGDDRRPSHGYGWASGER